jgi:SAM-dependent methyltransferase
MDEERRKSFGSVAESYDRVRPPYPAAVVDDVLEFAPAGKIRVLDVGAGTGKATVQFAPRVASVLALEPNTAMAALARRNCSRFGSVAIEEIEFEAWNPGDARFELLICAQAWHWLAPAVRVERAREALVDGGAIALFWNWPRWEDCALVGDFRRAYRRAAPDFRAGAGSMHPGHDPQLAEWRNFDPELRADAAFGACELRAHEWTREYSRDGYLTLLQTHSDHIVLDEDRRAALLDSLGAVIDAAGGRFTLPYVTYLMLARRVTASRRSPGRDRSVGPGRAPRWQSSARRSS